MKTCSSLVKNIDNAENNFMKNKLNKWVKYRNVLHKPKNADDGSI